MPAVDLRADGTLGIDFDYQDGSTKTVTVKPPKVGGYRRLRHDLYQIDTAQAEFTNSLPEELSDEEKRNRAVAWHEDALIGWWRLVLMGDDTFASLADAAVPEDADAWPLEFATNAAALGALSHWIATPFRHSSPASPTTNEPQL